MFYDVLFTWSMYFGPKKLFAILLFNFCALTAHTRCSRQKFNTRAMVGQPAGGVLKAQALRGQDSHRVREAFEKSIGEIEDSVLSSSFVSRDLRVDLDRLQSLF